LTELKAAVASKPDLRQAYALLARAYRLLGQQTEAVESLKKASQLEEREHEYMNRALIQDDLSLAPPPDIE
jgi:Tfp pilus assembly protein PilF